MAMLPIELASRTAFGDKMQSATEREFNAALGNAPRARKRHIEGGPRTMEVEWSDRGTLVAQKTILYTRGKVSQEMYMVNPEYLPGGSMARRAKFPEGKKMTVEEVAKVVGPEFKEMHDNPPESVKKMRKEMEESMEMEEGKGLLPIERAASEQEAEKLQAEAEANEQQAEADRAKAQAAQMREGSDLLPIERQGSNIEISKSEMDALHKKGEAEVDGHTLLYKQGRARLTGKQKLPEELKKHQFTEEDNPNPKGNDKDGDGKTNEPSPIKGKKAADRKLQKAMEALKHDWEDNPTFAASPRGGGGDFSEWIRKDFGEFTDQLDDQLQSDHPKMEVDSDTGKVDLASWPMREYLAIARKMAKKAAPKPIGSGKNGYIAHYKSKQVEVMANTSLEAQEIAAKHFRTGKAYHVNVVLVEQNGKQVTHKTHEMFAADKKSSRRLALQRKWPWSVAASLDEFNDTLVKMAFVPDTPDGVLEWDQS